MALDEDLTVVTIKWFLIIASMVVGVFINWQYQIITMAILLVGYVACFNLGRPNFQIVLGSLYGGLATGLGLQFLIAYGSKDRIIEMIIVPLLVWLVLRVLFYAAETKYTLHPNEALKQTRDEFEAASYFEDSVDHRSDYVARKGTSAWAGSNSGIADTGDETGYRISYEFFHSGGEIAMGGPTYGEAVFSNGCAFTGVGPSIALSEDGRYAAMTKPSRDTWGLLIADLHEKRVYDSAYGGIWELDYIENGVIYGRESPITHNTGLHLSIEKAIASAKELLMVQDDGWWVIDDANREPFAHYKAVTISSKQGQHKVTFVPDLKPHKSNPFMRDRNPDYNVLVDDELVEFKTDIKRAEALWVDGLPHEKVADGRFLVLPNMMIDFRDAVHDVFSIKDRTIFPLHKGCDRNTYLDFEYGKKSDAGNGYMLAQGHVFPKATDTYSAEYVSYGNTSPWDEEEVIYWDAKGRKRTQLRTLINRQIEYKIDLPKFSTVQDIKKCTTIRLLNRGHPSNAAGLTYQNASNDKGGYSAYQLTTSCGVELQNILHEAIWSRCGRYLAVVHFEHPPLVPHKISVIDFKVATVKTLAGSFALPSFIWFDGEMLDFTHVVGIEEYLIFGPDRLDDEKRQLRISEPEYAVNPYNLLIDGIDQRLANAEKKVESKKSKVGYSSATVSLISQHCILFAPAYVEPMLQPPVEIKS